MSTNLFVYDLGDNAEQTLQEMDAYENAESPPPKPPDERSDSWG
jgi:hypothetical protein